MEEKTLITSLLSVGFVSFVHRIETLKTEQDIWKTCLAYCFDTRIVCV